MIPILGDNLYIPKKFADRILMGYVQKTGIRSKVLKHTSGIIHYHDTFAVGTQERIDEIFSVV